jgi:hypothetical protein
MQRCLAYDYQKGTTIIPDSTDNAFQEEVIDP